MQQVDLHGFIQEEDRCLQNGTNLCPKKQKNTKQLMNIGCKSFDQMKPKEMTSDTGPTCLSVMRPGLRQ